MSDVNLDDLKQQMCDIGSRLYQKGFAAANEGNLSARIDQERVLCTPTRFCKGFMKPDDLCVVDLSGEQLGGQRKRTSEVMLHLEIYRHRKDVGSVVHCHPPHATAFAVAGQPIPTCVLPEPDIFLGEVPISRYETPGGEAFAQTILPFVKETNTIILANHGTVSYESDLETAFWLTEILDAYCRILILASQLGNINFVTVEQGRALLALRKAWGFSDSRDETDGATNPANFELFGKTWKDAGLRCQPIFRHPSTNDSSPASATAVDDQLLDRLADRIVEKLKREGS